jgi:hypothetical protein
MNLKNQPKKENVLTFKWKRNAAINSILAGRKP